MSINIESKGPLLAQARRDWIRTQQTEQLNTGQPARPVPADSTLVAYYPTVAQEIRTLENAKANSGFSSAEDSGAHHNDDKSSPVSVDDQNASTAGSAHNKNGLHKKTLDILT